MFTNHINIDFTLFKLWFYFPFHVYGRFSQSYLLYLIHTGHIGAVKVLHNQFWHHSKPSAYRPKSVFRLLEGVSLSKDVTIGDREIPFGKG